MAEGELPTEDELREALDRVGVADILLNALSAAASIGFHRVSPEARDLEQVRLAIESLRALDPVLREGGVDEAIVRDLEQARTNLQLAYAKAVVGGASCRRLRLRLRVRHSPRRTCERATTTSSTESSSARSRPPGRAATAASRRTPSPFVG